MNTLTVNNIHNRIVAAQRQLMWPNPTAEDSEGQDDPGQDLSSGWILQDIPADCEEEDIQAFYQQWQTAHSVIMDLDMRFRILLDRTTQPRKDVTVS